MQFSLTGTGKPADAKASIEQQATEIKKGSDPQAAAATASVAGGLIRYLDSQDPAASVSLSASIFVTVSNPPAVGIGG